MNKIFLNQGYVKKKNFLNNVEKKDILKVIYETFSKEIKIPNKKNFSIENKEFHEKLLDLRKKNSHILVKGEEKLVQILHENKPVIFISGHFANFELMSMEITKKNIPLATIYRPLNNFFLNPLMEYLRKKYVCKNQIKKGVNGVREAITYIKNKHSIALMIDQRVTEGKKVNFFNKPALTTTLPAQLSYKFKLNIIPVFIERDGNDNFIIEFQDRISSHKYKDKIELTEKLNKVLEKMVMRNPNQWIWTHNRWK